VSKRQHYLVSYDIRDEKRWRKVYKLIHGYGERVQYSIFSCLLSDKQLAELRWKLTKVMDPEDSLLMAPIDPERVQHLFALNIPADWDKQRDRFRTL
jgi:CRISPR-associated protein Cas2